MAKIDETIESLQLKLKQAKALKAKQEALARAAEKKKQRSDDTRRKVLVGAAVLARVQRGEWEQAKLLALLDAELTRADDRALFNLQNRQQGQGN